jgi:hypothetical protein
MSQCASPPTGTVTSAGSRPSPGEIRIAGATGLMLTEKPFALSGKEAPRGETPLTRSGAVPRGFVNVKPGPVYARRQAWAPGTAVQENVVGLRRLDDLGAGDVGLGEGVRERGPEKVGVLAAKCLVLSAKWRGDG